MVFGCFLDSKNQNLEQKKTPVFNVAPELFLPHGPEGILFRK